MATLSTGLASRLLGNESFEQLMRWGAIDLYSGTAPASPDLQATGTLLARITRDGLAWTPGSSVGGLEWRRDGRFAVPALDHVWQLTVLVTGTPTWFRIRANPVETGVSSSDVLRVDGVIGYLDTPGAPADLFLPTSLVSAGATRNVENFSFTLT